jgi:hypothetical protein
LDGAARERAAAVNWRISTSMFLASGWCRRKRTSGSLSFWMGGMSRFSAAAIRGKEHFATGPVVGFAVHDLPAAVDELRRAGVELLGEPGPTWQHVRGPTATFTSSSSAERPSAQSNERAQRRESVPDQELRALGECDHACVDLLIDVALRRLALTVCRS